MAEQNKNSAASPQNETADAPKGASAASAPEEAVASGAVSAEELEDAVLEAEAAAIVDNALDEVEAEAQAADSQKEAAEWKDKYMRLHAEWDTYRRRTKEQQEVQ